MSNPDRWVWPYWLADKWGRFSPRDGMWLAIAACLWLHAPVSLAVSECVWSKKELCSCALHASCMMPLPSFCICTPGKEVGWIIIHATIAYTRPRKKCATNINTKIDRLKVEIVHILVIITAVTQNHGDCRKSRHKAKITVITAIVNSWFKYIPSDGISFCTPLCFVSRVQQPLHHYTIIM